MWVALIQLLEGLQYRNWGFPESEKFCFEIAIFSPLWGFSLPPSFTDFSLAAVAAAYKFASVMSDSVLPIDNGLSSAIWDSPGKSVLLAQINTDPYIICASECIMSCGSVLWKTMIDTVAQNGMVYFPSCWVPFTQDIQRRARKPLWLW